MSRADKRGWGRGWPQDNSAKMKTVRAEQSGVVLAVHREIAPIVKHCIDTIEDRGYLFDHGPMDVNDDWGYANRPIRGTSIPSNHSWGLAVDLDAQEYPQGQRKRQPPQWIDDIFAKYRFDNGAPWANPDPMHYEFNGTPKDAQFLVAALAAHSIEGTAPPAPPSAPPAPSPPPNQPLVLPPPFTTVQEDDMIIYALDLPVVEYWQVYGDGFARNLDKANGEADALRRIYPVRLVARADVSHFKNSVNELSYAAFKARQP